MNTFEVGLRWIAMALVVVCPATAHSAGLRDLVIPADPSGPNISAELWTPCAKPNVAISVEHGGVPTTLQAVKDCAVKGKNLPLILISHGMLEDRFSHFDTAASLADAGFAVVSFNHTRDSVVQLGAASVDDVSSFFVRPLDVKRVLDHLTAHPPTGVGIDLHRIGFFGFSRGGYTGLVLAGGVPDFDSLIIPCPEQSQMCQQIKKHSVPPPPSGAEPRIGVYVIADPVNLFPSKASLKNVKAPIQLWGSDLGGMGVRPEDVDAVVKNLPAKPDFHRVAGSKHLSFDAPCSKEQTTADPPILICAESTGFDRVGFHQTFNAEMAAFFRKNLPP